MPQNDEYWNQGIPGMQNQASAYPATPEQPAGAAPAAAQPATGAPQQAFAQPTPEEQTNPSSAYYNPNAAAAAAVPVYAPAAVAAPVQKKSHGWIVGIVIAVCLTALVMFSISSCSNAFVSLVSLAPQSHSSLEGLDRDAVVVIDINGTIQYDGSACSPEGLKYLLDEAEANPHVKAIVLRVDSGGGTATAGEEMAEYVRQCSLPIVVSSASLNASAAYEISAQADYIYVAKSTEIGAIGTAMTITDMSELLEKLGIKMDTIVSSDEKDSSYGYRSLTDEERAYYQAMVDEINQVFLENVAAGRNMSIDEVEKLATGMPFTGVTAVENGLADEVGTREDAIAKAAELAGISEYQVRSLRIDSYDLSSLYYLLGSRYGVDGEQLLGALDIALGAQTR